MIDIAHFKQVNDRWGHDVGDRVLKSIADVLSSSARGYDLVSRIGGEEFLVICAHSGLDESRQLAHRALYQAKRLGRNRVAVADGRWYDS